MINPTLTTIAFLSLFAGQALSQEEPLPSTIFSGGPPPSLVTEEGYPPPMITPGQKIWWEDPQDRAKPRLGENQILKIERMVRDQQMEAIDLRADLEKQDVLLKNLMESDSPDKTQVLAQVDKLSEACGRLEKSRLEMFFAVRNVLTPEQVRKLSALTRGPMSYGSDFGPPEVGFPVPSGGPPE